jgi:predicted RNA-binding Zn ribbon-like protein
MADAGTGRESGVGRFRVTVAPGELRFVQDLLNTASAAGGRASWPDLLDAPSTAAAWFRSAGLSGDSAGLRDLQQLRDVIRQLLVARDHGASGDAARIGAIEAPVTASLAQDGTVSVAPSSEGAASLRGRALLAIRDAQVTGAWRRLKVCRNPECRVAFWDTSRNCSGVWHDVRTCGNITNLRNSRARRAKQVLLVEPPGWLVLW